MKITHLCIYVPPLLGAYLLLHHAPKPPTFLIPTPAQSSQEETTVVRLSRTAHFLLPTVIEQQAERLRTARQAAAQGMLSSYTIPLLADIQTLLNKGKINWTLKFPLPLPTERPSNRRFSSLPIKVGPCGEQALEGAVHYAAPFNYSNLASTHLFDIPFLALPDPTAQYGEIRQVKLDYQVHPDIANWLLSGAPRIYDKSDLNRAGFQHIQIPPLLVRYFCNELDLQQARFLLDNYSAHIPAALDAAAAEYRKAKRQKLAVARLPPRLAPFRARQFPAPPATPPTTPRTATDMSRSRIPPPHTLCGEHPPEASAPSAGYPSLFFEERPVSFV